MASRPFYAELKLRLKISLKILVGTNLLMATSIMVPVVYGKLRGVEKLHGADGEILTNREIFALTSVMCGL